MLARRPAREEEQGPTGEGKSQAKFTNLTIKKKYKKTQITNHDTLFIYILHSLLEFQPMLDF
jgi:hypothetical protein